MASGADCIESNLLMHAFLHTNLFVGQRRRQHRERPNIISGKENET